MAKVISTQILIHAKPATVWDVLIDFEKYPDWNPFITSTSGTVRVGNKVKIKLEPPGSKSMIFNPEILVLEENKKLSWLGRLGFKGLFDGEHQFELIDNGDGSTTFVHSERFTGILVPLFIKRLDKGTKQGFISMNEKIKTRCEHN